MIVYVFNVFSACGCRIMKKMIDDDRFSRKKITEFPYPRKNVCGNSPAIKKVSLEKI